MNAIQYFDWGGGIKENYVPFFKVIVKNIFVNQKGIELTKKIPITLPYDTTIAIDTIMNNKVVPGTVYKTKKSDLSKDGSDLICQTYIKHNFGLSQKLHSISVNCNTNNIPYFALFDTYWRGDVYIGGRKIKNGYIINGVKVYNANIQIALAGNNELGWVFEDNLEEIPFNSLFGKEIELRIRN